MVVHIVDENIAPAGAMDGRQRAKLNHGHEDEKKLLKPTSRIPSRIQRKSTGIAAKRAILGDVTNKATIAHGQKQHAMKKQSEGPVHMKRVTRSMEKPGKRKSATLMDYTPMVESSNVKKLRSPEPFVKESPMNISYDMEEMTLAQEEQRQKEREKALDIDSMDRENQLAVSYYAEEIFRHFKVLEEEYKASPTYMQNQKDINSKMRAILVDWLVDVHAKYHMLPQVLHITIDLLDRYLSADHTIIRQRLQLAGVTSMLLASKYEEIYPPDAMDFVKITDMAYELQEVFDMERTMLKAIGYRMTIPTKCQFLTRYIKAAELPRKEANYFANYIIDRSLQEYKFLKYSHSFVAAAAVYLTRSVFGDGKLEVWTEKLHHHTGYSAEELQKCVRELQEMLWNAQMGVSSAAKLTAVKRKYGKDKFGKVSTIPIELEQ